jgi:branched-chain amino acid transport system ATP-binding protein
MATKPKILLLDEPAAGMNHEETTELSVTLRNLVNITGVGILVIDHDMALMRQLCDRLVVLDHGKVICEGTPDAVLADPEVATLYLGASAENTDKSPDPVPDGSVPTKGA